MDLTLPVGPSFPPAMLASYKQRDKKGNVVLWITKVRDEPESTSSSARPPYRTTSVAIGRMEYGLALCRKFSSVQGTWLAWCCRPQRPWHSWSTMMQRRHGGPSRRWPTSASRTSRCTWSGRRRASSAWEHPLRDWPQSIQCDSDSLPTYIVEAEADCTL